MFHALLLAKSGTFTLLDEEPERNAAPLSVSTQSLLMDGIRRIDELLALPGADPRARPRSSAGASRHGPVPLRPTETRCSRSSTAGGPSRRSRPPPT